MLCDFGEDCGSMEACDVKGTHISKDIENLKYVSCIM